MTDREGRAVISLPPLTVPNRQEVAAYLEQRPAVADQARRAMLLHDNSRRGGACQFDERFLQALWNEQCLSPDIRTVDGRPVHVLDPGTWNAESGPDFKRAAVRIGTTVFHGDVEVHRTNRDWWAHAHDADPAYDTVVLHVVWQHRSDTRDTDLPPCVALREHIQQPWETLSRQMQLDSYPYARKVPPGLCSVQWVGMSNADIQWILRIAGMARLQGKTLGLQEDIIAHGPEQCLYRALFDALGYKVNRGPFRRLAELMPLAELRKLPPGCMRHAALFGAAGLLPDPSTARVCDEMRGELKTLWDAWWRLGRPRHGLQWTRGRTRPLNFPERRLAAGLLILDRCDCSPARQLEQMADTAGCGRELIRQLRHFLDVDGPWQNYATFETRLKKPADLLGQSRKDDIIVNTLLPFLRAHASMRRNHELQDRCDQAYVAMPLLQSNRLMKEIEHRLFVPPSRAREVVRHACEQQGLLAIHHDYCVVADSGCENCPAAAPTLAQRIAAGS